MDNIILSSDSYKSSHFLQYPYGATNVFSYVESRKGGEYNSVLFFGLQMFLDKLVNMRVTNERVREAELFFRMHGEPFNREGWDRIIDVHSGRLPISIRAVPEGSVVPAGNVLVTVENTDPALPWLTSYLETVLLRAVWYPSTVATTSFRIKQWISDFLKDTCDNPEAVLPFRLHDFGARGVSSQESAEIGGAAHLVNFMGTDTVEAALAVMRHYGGGMPGFSIPAAEHSTITSWGRDREVDAYKNMIDKFGGDGKIYTIVSDSYDLDNAVNNIFGGVLKDEIIAKGGTLVVRPDSGNPVHTPVRAVSSLLDKFGGNVNSKGYLVLPDYIRVIQGDGINEGSIFSILSELKNLRISAENIAFGMGGALLQGINRDTARFAMKASAIKIDDVWQDVQKNPKTDHTKASKAGRLALIRDAGEWMTVPLEGNAWRNELVEVFRDGEIKKRWTFDEIRARAASFIE